MHHKSTNTNFQHNYVISKLSRSLRPCQSNAHHTPGTTLHGTTCTHALCHAAALAGLTMHIMHSNMHEVISQIRPGLGRADATPSDFAGSVLAMSHLAASCVVVETLSLNREQHRPETRPQTLTLHHGHTTPHKREVIDR